MENNENNVNENQFSENQVKETKQSFNLGKEVWEWFYTIVIAFAIAMSIKTFILDVVRVDGPSMYPTLVHNDRLVISKLGYTPHTGDIVILDSTYKKRMAYYEEYEERTGKKLNLITKGIVYLGLEDNLKPKYYVKRIIGMPGDSVDIIDGKVYVNGEMLDEEYYDGVTSITDYSVKYPFTVSEDSVFVMGDNRPNSLDSRSSSLGEVPIKALEGKSQLRLWPLTAIGKTK